MNVDIYVHIYVTILVDKKSDGFFHRLFICFAISGILPKYKFHRIIHKELFFYLPPMP
ncbi:hypothetical protein BMS3Abin15_00697 [bacterium BMS3Abin15]|nr:hypothetical protein BMS3Abin15_00697 [bacterium BMS3Abin15]